MMQFNFSQEHLECARGLRRRHGKEIALNYLRQVSDPDYRSAQRMGAVRKSERAIEKSIAKQQVSQSLAAAQKSENATEKPRAKQKVSRQAVVAQKSKKATEKPRAKQKVSRQAVVAQKSKKATEKPRAKQKVSRQAVAAQKSKKATEKPSTKQKVSRPPEGWRIAARSHIKRAGTEILKNNPEIAPQQLEKWISKTYPFGFKENQPYKVWRQELKKYIEQFKTEQISRLLAQSYIPKKRESDLQNC